ncbi:serine/threonine protein kinase [Myxococcus sp. CA051A]|uniref:serine/threonine-protein kinase n=1 Tax=Myxococcus sp. CA051A TaxID=2741739 RepID=UPI00157B3D04|nr:serine/threonine protein kinase [Myxococcus sp. CA051A]
MAPAGAYRPDAEEDTDEATFKRERNMLPEPVRPLVSGVPPAYSARAMKWEESVTRDALVGTKVGDYLIKRRIGRGGMGIVYEGEHAVIGRRVAVKVIRPDFVEGGRARDLATEARSAAAIRHRGIIDIFGFGTIPDVGQYLVMEYLEGAPLDEVIHQRAPMLEVEVIRILDALLSALAAAHGVGVIHRDLKPGNVFMVREGDGSESVKVLDFGIAKRSEAPYGSTPQTHANALVGTPEYIAPEQACGHQVSPQTDLYAVGVIAYELLTRRLPFEGESAMAIIVHHVRTPPPPLSKYREVNSALEALVMRLLAKEPTERPASAESVRRELKHVLAGFSEGATRLSAPPPETRATELLQAIPQVKGKKGGRREPRRRGPISDSERPTSIMVTPTMLLEATSLDHKPLRPLRSRKLLVGGALALVVVVGGWAFLAQARTRSPRRDTTRARVQKTAPRGMGTVVLKVNGPPLQDVLVDGKSHGEKYVLELPEGIHQLEVRGRDLGRPHSSSVDIRAGAFIEHHVTLPSLL